MVSAVAAARAALAADGDADDEEVEEAAALDAAQMAARQAELASLATVHAEHIRKLQHWAMAGSAEIVDLDECGAGLELPERLFLEAVMHRADISHPPGWETGRPSEPDYMDLNLHATREPAAVGLPAVVVQQIDEAAPLNPRGLLIAYEEAGHVLPVASDFDSFLIGSRGIAYPPMPKEHLPFLHSLIRHIEAILAEPGTASWMKRWLMILKRQVRGASRESSRVWEWAVGTVAHGRHEAGGVCPPSLPPSLPPRSQSPVPPRLLLPLLSFPFLTPSASRTHSSA